MNGVSQKRIWGRWAADYKPSDPNSFLAAVFGLVYAAFPGREQNKRAGRCVIGESTKIHDMSAYNMVPVCRKRFLVPRLSEDGSKLERAALKPHRVPLTCRMAITAVNLTTG